MTESEQNDFLEAYFIELVEGEREDEAPEFVFIWDFIGRVLGDGFESFLERDKLEVATSAFARFDLQEIASKINDIKEVLRDKGVEYFEHDRTLLDDFEDLLDREDMRIVHALYDKIK
jgi:hypothetical protein